MDDFVWDTDNPLDRAKGERSNANSALRDYARMGNARSLTVLAEDYARRQQEESDFTPPTTSAKTLQGWSTRFDWQNRILRFSDMQEERKQAIWQDRKDAMREAEWNDGQLLRERVVAVLEAMERFIRQSQETSEDDDGNRTIIIREAMAVSLNEASLALQRASAIQRLATDEPTETIQLTGAALDAAIERELRILYNRRETSPTEPPTTEEPPSP